MDRHAVEGTTPEALAKAHQADVHCQAKYGCKCFTYWFDEQRQSIFCLVEAPSRQAVQDMHRAAHGMLANQIIEVDGANVASFLGRLTDPEGADREPIREPAFRAIMFTDMANSTDVTNRIGDRAAFDLLQTHHTIIRQALVAHGGREVDHAGDGFLSCFSSVAAALDCAIAIQKAFHTYNSEAGREVPIHVRIGLGAGEPVADGDALFGSTINLTARICARSQPDQILAAPVIRDLCVGKLYKFIAQGRVKLKGIPDAMHLHEVAWQ